MVKKKKKKMKKREAQLVTEVIESRLLVVCRAKGRRTEGGREGGEKLGLAFQEESAR